MNRILFSDRLWIVKVTAALLIFSWMCHIARRDFVEIMPPTAWMPTAFDRVKGKTIYPYPRRVEAVTDEGFEIVHPDAGRLFVRTPIPPPVGARVAFAGKVVGPRTLEATVLQIREGWEWKRPANYLLSIATLAVFLFLIRRRFRWRPESGLFRSRY